MANQEAHAQALLTCTRQVRPAQLALTSHLYKLRVGCLWGGVGPQCQETSYMEHGDLRVNSPGFPQTL